MASRIVFSAFAVHAPATQNPLSVHEKNKFKVFTYISFQYLFTFIVKINFIKRIYYLKYYLIFSNNFSNNILKI